MSIVSRGSLSLNGILSPEGISSKNKQTYQSIISIYIYILYIYHIYIHIIGFNMCFFQHLSVSVRFH